MDIRVGSGRRQQAILRVMSDGRPRTTATIAQKAGFTSRSTIVGLCKRGWLVDSGERGYYRARLLVISEAGRAMIRKSVAGE